MRGLHVPAFAIAIILCAVVLATSQIALSGGTTDTRQSALTQQ